MLSLCVNFDVKFVHSCVLRVRLQSDCDRVTAHTHVKSLRFVVCDCVVMHCVVRNSVFFVFHFV